MPQSTAGAYFSRAGRGQQGRAVPRAAASPGAWKELLESM